MAELGTLRPLSRPGALRDRIHERLREAILQGELAPGTPVIEADLAQRLGASRTPVREALRRLESEGLLVPRGTRGTVVRTLDDDAVVCVVEIREALETLAARRAAERVDEVSLRRIERALEEMSARLDDPVALERADTAFHDEIVRVAGGARLTKLLTEIREETIQVRFLSLADATRRRTTLDEHAAIVAALRDRDPVAAERAMRLHVANAGAAARRSAS